MLILVVLLLNKLLLLLLSLLLTLLLLLLLLPPLPHATSTIIITTTSTIGNNNISGNDSSCIGSIKVEVFVVLLIVSCVNRYTSVSKSGSSDISIVVVMAVVFAVPRILYDIIKLSVFCVTFNIQARSNWRPYMRDAVSSIITDAATVSQTEIDNYSISEVALIVNKGLWAGALGKSIVFKGGQTPLIYDPMSVMVFGYASCTGVSIVYIDALRSVGIPSRLAGTPAW